MSDWTMLVEAGRGIIAASRLGGPAVVARGPQDEKFALGDLLAGLEGADELDDDQLNELAREIGPGLTGGNLKSYREVARAWPAEQRVEASWTTHRTLMKAPNRFELITPGMTLRGAQRAYGKTPADTEHPSRWPLERRVDYLITQLQDPPTAKAVREQVEGRKFARAARAASRAVEEERSAEYREALRELREARDAKHPERAVYDAIFKLRDAREYVRAVGRASADVHSFMPDHRKPDVVAAVRDLALGAIEVLGALSANDPGVSSQALKDVLDGLSSPNKTNESANFDGTVDSQWQETDTRPSDGTVLHGELV
ncbi:MAG: hypothetical protein QOI54_3309 [Actinomycetota bacterium]|jgi:hypothetical protein|nr:hypothetical protein [Actinomycetota bacterium]